MTEYLIRKMSVQTGLVLSDNLSLLRNVVIVIIT